MSTDEEEEEMIDRVPLIPPAHNPQEQSQVSPSTECSQSTISSTQLAPRHPTDPLPEYEDRPPSYSYHLVETDIESRIESGKVNRARWLFYGFVCVLSIGISKKIELECIGLGKRTLGWPMLRAAGMSRPIFTSMTTKLTASLSPTHLSIVDESTQHAEHEAMRGQGFNETHFNVLVVSDKFTGKMPVQRHRAVYALLDDEFKGGLHAISLKTLTPAEYAKTAEQN